MGENGNAPDAPLPVLIVVDDRACPGCGEPLNVGKVHDGQCWWDKCQNESCWVGFVGWDVGQIETKSGRVVGIEHEEES